MRFTRGLGTSAASRARKSSGVPDLDASKVQEQHRALFCAGEPIDEERGRALLAWNEGSVETISAADAPELHQLITESGADVARFLVHFAIESVAALPARQLDTARNMLSRKRRA